MGNCVTKLTSDRLVHFTHYFLCSISCVDSGRRLHPLLAGNPKSPGWGLDPFLLVQNRN